MKIIYTGQLPIKNAELALAGIFKANDTIYPGTIFEIPDNNVKLITKILAGGNYSEYVEPKKPIKAKKNKKEENEKEEK